ncbi:MAG: hypothetical protein JSV17_10510 [Candidatus Aminicenantes bacterium]|nr:MAG: hypothetical protein JSV17_10510 [Candidatus Aminicenantes bacterium]
MKIKGILLNFAIFFVITFGVSAIVNFLWNLIFHGTGTVGWEMSFRLAIILGIVLSWIQKKE